MQHDETSGAARFTDSTGTAGGARLAEASANVVTILRDRIVQGVLAPGDRLVERTLARELGVSRIPVRDALNILKGEGFVTAYPHRGMLVRALTEDDISELFEVREVLEVLVARLAASRATDEDLERLSDAVEAAQGGPGGQADQRFHDILTECAHNDFLTGLMQPIEGRIHWVFRRSPGAERFQEEHQAILSALRRKNPTEAAEAALDHVRSSHAIWRESHTSLGL